MAQFISAIIIIVFIKILFDNIKPLFRKKQSTPSGDFIDISEKWINVDEMPYKKSEYLLENPELRIFNMLNDILSRSRYYIFPRMRMADILGVPAGIQNRQEYIYRIKERSLDMVIFESDKLNPVLVINLISRGGKKQQINEQFTENALKAADLKYINLDLENPPEPEQLIGHLRGSGLVL